MMLNSSKRKTSSRQFGMVWPSYPNHNTIQRANPNAGTIKVQTKKVCSPPYLQCAQCTGTSCRPQGSLLHDRWEWVGQGSPPCGWGPGPVVRPLQHEECDRTPSLISNESTNMSSSLSMARASCKRCKSKECTSMHSTRNPPTEGVLRGRQ